MKNLKIKFFLPFFVILFSGYGQLYAHSCLDKMTSAFVSYENITHETPLKGCFNTLQLSQSPDKYRNIKLRATDNEVEEEEITSSKKVIVSNNYFSSFYSSLSANDFTSYLKKRAPFYSFFYHFTACKIFVVFQVFRL
ncbi:hypothetical protein SLW70_09755 [Flavobacterium sp. NG2]|uniref:hypothetical protein n=1 Tax=Flavobacterium sp. NG2 TaxID=3097547 RepID=UPI002A841D08|nr:hypothetical protein [Flavobacterium sp. NG2]WPR70229.1 hypothetical protein SLW70_09755 [Flavobacterium sp. NG2]